MKLYVTSILALSALLFSQTGCSTAPAAAEDPVALGKHQYDNYCMPCHAPDGTGNPANEAPGIAGLPTWYVAAQLRKFRMGVRGGHFDDIAGHRMRPMSRALVTEEAVDAVAAYVAGMSKQRLDGSVDGGDAEKGKAAYAVCAACHGPNGEGNELLNAPPLAGQDDWYMLTQLHNFKAGIRGADERDMTGATMRPNAMTMDDQAMLDVVAYVKTLK